MCICFFVIFCYERESRIKAPQVFFLEIDKTITLIGGCTELRILLKGLHGELI